MVSMHGLDCLIPRAPHLPAGPLTVFTPNRRINISSGRLPAESSSALSSFTPAAARKVLLSVAMWQRGGVTHGRCETASFRGHDRSPVRHARPMDPPQIQADLSLSIPRFGRIPSVPFAKSASRIRVDAGWTKPAPVGTEESSGFVSSCRANNSAKEKGFLFLCETAQSGLSLVSRVICRTRGWREGVLVAGLVRAPFLVPVEVSAAANDGWRGLSNGCMHGVP